MTNDDGQVLFLRRPDHSHGAGGWCLPGGKVDYGDTVQGTVAKELREETGLECTGMRFLFYQDSLPIESGGMHVINLYFECDVEGEIRLNEESTERAWISRDEMSSYSVVFGNDEALQRYWKAD